MKYLFDTCMLSEINHPNGNQKVKAYATQLPQENVFISVVSIGEIAKGISALAEGSRKHALSQWLQQLLHTNQAQLLNIDAAVSVIWGELVTQLQQRGKHLHMADGLIAATAINHNMQLVTRNVKDFEHTGVLLVNPWING